MRYWPVAYSACLLLTSCGTPVYTIPLGRNEYEINATAPGGMYGVFIGLTPSKGALPKRAAEICPNGYEKISEREGSFEGKFIGWKIRCRPSDAP